MDSLYNENHIWGRLFRKFMDPNLPKKLYTCHIERVLKSA